MTDFRTHPFEQLTRQEAAEEYVKTIYAPVNGWGANVHPILGDSFVIMKKMREAFGIVETHELIAKAMAEYASLRMSFERSQRHAHR